MKLLKHSHNKIQIEITENEFFILRAIISEIYSGVCVDSDEFEIIHGIQQDDVNHLENKINEIYNIWKPYINEI